MALAAAPSGLPEKSQLRLHPVSPVSAEEKQGILKRIQSIGQAHDGRKAINGLSHIRLAAGHKDADILWKLNLHDDRPIMLRINSNVCASAPLRISILLPFLRITAQISLAFAGRLLTSGVISENWG